MQHERLLAGGAVAILAITLLSAALVPGVLAEREVDRPSSRLDLQDEDATISVLSVPGDTVDLRIDTRLSNRGGPAENVSVEVRAVDDGSGLLQDSETQTVGALRADRTASITTNLTVPREGSYRIETIVYEDGSRRTKGIRTISGVGSLTPDYARSTVEFHRYVTGSDGFGSIATRVRRVDGDRVTLNASTHLRNVGGTGSDDVTVRLRARQAESNLIADTTVVNVGSIGPGATRFTYADLEVPDGYNYWIDAILLNDGVVVDTTVAPVNLLTNESLSPDQAAGDEGGIDVSDLAQQTARPDDDDRDDGTAGAETETAGPGFGPIAAVVGLLAAALLLARRHDP